MEILRKNRSDYDEDDIPHVKMVVGYVYRHQAQSSKGDIKGSWWRYSLMN